MPTLRRLSDGRGDSGALIEIIAWNEDDTFKEIVDNGGRPLVGCSVRVGSVTARSYSSQDWWMTTPVTEILEERFTDDGHLEYVKFKTKNSVYEIF